MLTEHRKWQIFNLLNLVDSAVWKQYNGSKYFYLDIKGKQRHSCHNKITISRRSFYVRLWLHLANNHWTSERICFSEFLLLFPCHNKSMYGSSQYIQLYATTPMNGAPLKKPILSDLNEWTRMLAIELWTKGILHGFYVWSKWLYLEF